MSQIPMGEPSFCSSQLDWLSPDEQLQYQTAVPNCEERQQ